ALADRLDRLLHEDRVVARARPRRVDVVALPERGGGEHDVSVARGRRKRVSTAWWSPRLPAPISLSSVSCVPTATCVAIVFRLYGGRTMATQVAVGTQLTEDKLIRAGKRGDHQAVETLFRRYQRPLFQTALRVLGNTEDAEDALQDGMLSA